MGEVKNMKVDFIDNDHVFIDNKQFVSLKRFANAKMDMIEEMKLLLSKNSELIKENKALKALIKTNI